MRKIVENRRVPEIVVSVRVASFGLDRAVKLCIFSISTHHVVTYEQMILF